MQTEKAELYALYRSLYQSTSVEKDQIVRVLDILVSQATSRLIGATDTSAMMRIQGEVKALDKLRVQLTTAPATSQE